MKPDPRYGFTLILNRVKRLTAIISWRIVSGKPEELPVLLRSSWLRFIAIFEAFTSVFLFLPSVLSSDFT